MKTIGKRPLLIGGVGMSVALWLWDSLSGSVVELGGTLTLASLATGAGLWWWRQRQQPADRLDQAQAMATLDRATVTQAIALANQALQTLTAELAAQPAPSLTVPDHDTTIAALTADLDRRKIRIAVVGTKASGKSTLVSLLASPDHFRSPQPLTLQEIPISLETLGGAAFPDELTAADLVLVLTTGDLTQPDYVTLTRLVAQPQRVLVVFNKQDQYLPNDRPVLVARIQDYLSQLLSQRSTDRAQANYAPPLLPLADVVAIAAQPNPLKVRRHQPDGSTDEWLEAAHPDIAALTQRLQQVLQQESEQLVWATVLRSALDLRHRIQLTLNQSRRDRALPMIEQYQWIAAAAAFANPVPALDLLATGAINAQLVMDLAALHQQPFSLQQAQTVAGTLGTLLVKLGLVELSTQLLGGLFKSHAVTYVAGGVLQGASAAYLTRLAGLSLVDYFQDASLAVDLSGPNPVASSALQQKLQVAFDKYRGLATLQTLAQQTIKRFTPEQVPAIG